MNAHHVAILIVYIPCVVLAIMRADVGLFLGVTVFAAILAAEPRD